MVSFSVRRRRFGEPGSESGFTLLEVLVSLAILAIALTVLLSSQSQTMFAADEADFTSTAALLAESKMSEILGDGVGSGGAAGDFGADYPGYVWQVQVDDTTAAEIIGNGVDLRRITVVVLDERRKRDFVLTRYQGPGG